MSQRRRNTGEKFQYSMSSTTIEEYKMLQEEVGVLGVKERFHKSNNV